MRLKPSLVLILFVTPILFVILPSANAQDDCGNGLTQRLKVGGRGWIDSTPSAQPVRIRQEPGETQIALLQPGEEFTVLAGPRCFDTYSWFEIETDSGKSGWIAEGVQAGEYFVDPLVAPGIEVDTASCVGDPASFEVGQYVNLTRSPTESDLFYGHPLVEGGYFALATYFQHHEVFFNVVDRLSDLSADHLITKGAICVNDTYVWQIATDSMWFWLDESLLSLSENQPLAEPVFAPNIVNLTEPSPPLVAPELQIAWSGAAGGGGGGTLQIVQDGCQIDVRDHAITYEYACVRVYPFLPNEQVAIQIRQADGTLIYETTETAEATRLSITVDKLYQIETFGVTVYVPTGLGVTSGVYVIAATSPSIMHEVSYLFRESYGTRTVERAIATFCESGEAVVVGANFDAFEEIELVYVSATEFMGMTGGTVTYEEIYRWEVTSGQNGEFLATIDFDLPDRYYLVAEGYPLVREGYFVVADENGDWQPNFHEVIAAFTSRSPLADGLPDCTDSSYNIPDVIIPSVLEAPTGFILQDGQQYRATLLEVPAWTFSGEDGQVVQLYVNSEEMDVLLEIQTADGVVLVDDDDSGTRTDALIQGYILPTTGEFTVIVSSWGDKSGAYTIELELVTATTEAEVVVAESDNMPISTEVPVTQLETTCPGSPISRLEVGMKAQQALDNDPLRVREEPENDTTVLFYIFPGQQVTILDGPECYPLDSGESVLWWQIENSEGLSGWIVEGTMSRYYFEPLE